MSDLIPKVSIIILHLDNQPALYDCLRSCGEISYPNYDIIVVENGSKAPLTVTALQDATGRVSAVVRSPENVGYARGNNLGIQKALAAGADYVLLLNDDTIVSSGFLDPLVEEGEKNAGLGMIGPKILYADAPKMIWFAGGILNRPAFTITTPGSDQIDEGDPAEPFESDYITGCALLIGAGTIKRIGLLDERFFLYWEDVDWGLRAKRAGLKNRVVPSSRIWHKISVSSGGMESLVRVYHKTRSRLLLARLHAPELLPRLHCAIARDIAWLLLRSNDLNRFRKARAYMAAVRDYHRKETGKGPDWIWTP